MADNHIDVDLSDLAAQFDRLKQIDVDQAIMPGGLVVEGAAKANIIEVDFIDTGATLNSTQARPGDETGEVEVGPTTEWAIFGELGTRYMSARPFLVPALEESSGAIQKAVGDAIRDQLEKLAR